MRIGHGYDVHRLVSGRPCIIGGVNIPFELGLDGHSDADVLTHAVMDSLLGALALGDIGGHFPDTDPRYKGADSIALLRHVAALVREAAGSSAIWMRPYSHSAQARAAHSADAREPCRRHRLRGRAGFGQGDHRGGTGLYRLQTRHCRALRVPFRANLNSPIYYDNR